MTGRIAIVDWPGTSHGRAMARCARVMGFCPEVVWLRPGAAVADDLVQLRDVDAVALPFTIAAGRRDRTVMRIVSASMELRARGVPVFAAGGVYRRSVVAEGAVAVSPVGGRHFDFQTGPARFGGSGACVRAATIFSLFKHRRGRPRRHLGAD